MATEVRVAGVECRQVEIDGILNTVCTWVTRGADDGELYIMEQSTAEGEAFLTTLDDAETAANLLFV